MYWGAHAAWCQSRGYAAIGPHPDAPPAETQRAPSLAPEQCPCGRARAGCEYHDPTLQPPRQLEFEFTEDMHWTHVVCGPGVFVLDDKGEEIEMPVGATLSLRFK